MVVGLDGRDIQLFLEKKSFFVTYALPSGIYSIKDISEAIYTMGYHEGTLQIQYDDIMMKTKPILDRLMEPSER